VEFFLDALVVKRRDCWHLFDCKKVDSFYGAVETVIKLMLVRMAVGDGKNVATDDFQAWIRADGLGVCAHPIEL
jgi:hypothetical protein